MQLLTEILLWFSIVSTGLMAGVYFTFSAFAMRSLDEIEAPAGMLAMQSINRVIVRSLFLPIFFLSTAACAALVVIALVDLGAPGAMPILAGGTIYVIGMFGVTLVGNVPLNNRLEATPAASPEGVEMWKLYLSRWTLWNHARTVACTLSLVLLALGLSVRI